MDSWLPTVGHCKTHNEWMARYDPGLNTAQKHSPFCKTLSPDFIGTCRENAIAIESGATARGSLNVHLGSYRENATAIESEAGDSLT